MSCTEPTTSAGSQQTTPAEPKVLRDGDGLYKVRFAEIFLAGREAKTGKLVAACYNTSLFPNAISTSKDTAPQAWAEGLDLRMDEQASLAGTVTRQ